MRHAHRTSRRRGMALVMVLIFSVGAFVIVLTMLTLSSAGAKVEASRHHDKALQAVARFGLYTAVHEINRNRTNGPYDPTGNGPGCILVDPDGNRGWPVRQNGRLLGRFTTRVVVQDLGNGLTRRVLEVVAVDRDFPADEAEMQARLAAGTLRVMTAEVEVLTTGISFDRNALSIRGPAGNGGAGGFRALDTNSTFITGNDKPAVNISDATAHAKFVDDEALMEWEQVDGRDPLTGGAATETDTAAGRRKTVTNDSSGLLTQDTLSEAAEALNTRVDEVRATGTQLTDTSGTLAAGEYFIDGSLTLTGDLTGEGTLVINGGLTVSSGKSLNWKGKVIVANNNSASITIKGSMSVSEMLAIQGYGSESPTSMSVSLESGAKLVIGTTEQAGCFTILGDENTQNPLKFASGGGSVSSDNGLTVNGIFSIMGDALSMTFDSGSKLNVQGSLALITAEGATKGVDVLFQNSAKLTANYVGTNFDAAIDILGEFLSDDIGSEPIKPTSYVEDPARRQTLLEEHIATALDSEDFALE